MPDPPAVTVLTPKAGGRTRASHSLPPAPPTPVPPTASAFDGVGTVEIVAPDRFSATLLLGYAAPTFPAELVPGPAWIVRFQPPAAEGDWVNDLLALVERWLASTPLPCAKMRQGSRTYLIRGPLDAA